MFTITIEQYENIVDAIVENLNLKKFDNDAIHDHVESIDMHFNVFERDNISITHLQIDNIESLYDAINDVVETIRVHRYVDLKYKNNSNISFMSHNEFDQTFVIVEYDYSNNHVQYIERETITIEQIDEFEKTNNL